MRRCAATWESPHGQAAEGSQSAFCWSGPSDRWDVCRRKRLAPYLHLIFFSASVFTAWDAGRRLWIQIFTLINLQYAKHPCFLPCRRAKSRVLHLYIEVLGRHGKFTPIHHTPIYAPCKEIFCAFYDFYVDLTGNMEVCFQRQQQIGRIPCRLHLREKHDMIA